MSVTHFTRKQKVTRRKSTASVDPWPRPSSSIDLLAASTLLDLKPMVSGQKVEIRRFIRGRRDHLAAGPRVSDQRRVGSIFASCSVSDRTVDIMLRRQLDWNEWPSPVLVSLWMVSVLKGFSRILSFSSFESTPLAAPRQQQQQRLRRNGSEGGEETGRRRWLCSASVLKGNNWLRCHLVEKRDSRRKSRFTLKQVSILTL